MKSLRTIDETITGSLLPHDQVDAPKTSIQSTRLRNSRQVVLQIPELLSAKECGDILQTAEKQYGFQRVTTYLQSQRDSDRLCILDAALAQVLWQRLQAHKEHLAQATPFGFDNVASEWVPTRVNECFRLSRYTGPCGGFAPHYDGQYCASFESRSVWSVVVYLNEEFKGGDTVFYDPKTDDASVSGLTVAEEMQLNRHHSYDTVSVHPRTGHAVVFPHRVLHAGAPISDTGVKYVMRTDIVFVRQRTGGSLIGPALAAVLTGCGYRECLDTFREAQNCELDGDIARASELYERALSMRIRSSSSSSSMCSDDVWVNVLTFCSLSDLTAMRCTSRRGRAWVQRVKARMWLDARKRTRISKCLRDKPDLQFVPRLRTRSGTQCVFRYGKEQVAFVREHLEACLRVVAMSALFYFGLPSNADTFVAHYDPERRTVLQCSQDWLMTCAFFELPCSGTFYHLYRSACQDVSLDALPNKKQKKQKKQKKLLGIEEAFRIYVDRDFMADKNGDLADVHAFISDRADKRAYREAVKPEHHQFRTGFTELWREKRVLEVCKCGLGGTDWRETDSTTAHYNNVICDFSQHKLVVLPTSRHRCTLRQRAPDDCVAEWTAEMSDWTLPGFNHASCQCEELQVTDEADETEFGQQHILDHVHIYQLRSKTGNSIEFCTVYHGVAAL